MAEKVAAFERDQDVQLTPSTAQVSYLSSWIDVELVEQVEDGRLTATTRKYYGGQVANHIVSRLGAVSLRDLSAATIRSLADVATRERS